MDVAHYVYSPLKRAELVMIAYNTIIPLDMPKMTIEESVDVIDKHTTLVNCMGKMQKSEITSITSINGIDFRCDIRPWESDISRLNHIDEIIQALEEGKRKNYPGYAFLEDTGISEQIRELGKDR